MSCPVRVGWFLVNVRDADLVRCDFPVSTLKCTLIEHVGLEPPSVEGHAARAEVIALGVMVAGGGDQGRLPVFEN